jgi:hypothetical protein
MGREEAGFPDRFLVRTLGSAARLLAGAGRSLSGWKLTAGNTVVELKNKKRGGVMDTQDNPNPNSGGFCIQDILWAVGIWSVILTLSPVVMFYVLMVN